MIDHRHFAGQELRRQIGPLHDALVHNLILVLQVEPELERFDVFGRIEVDVLAVRTHQADAVGAVLEREAGEAPLRGTGIQRQTDALALVVGQLFAVLDQLIPVLRRLFRIEANLAESVLVVEHDHRRALERDGVDAAIHIGVQHEAVDEIIHEGLTFRIGRNQIIQRHGHLRVRHGETLGRKAHEQIRRVAALNRALDRRNGIVVVAGVDGLNADIRVLRVEVLRHRVDQRGRAAADVDREVHGQVERFRDSGHQAENHNQRQKSAYQFFHCKVSFSFIAIFRPLPGLITTGKTRVSKIETFHFLFLLKIIPTRSCDVN